MKGAPRKEHSLRWGGSLQALERDTVESWRMPMLLAAGIINAHFNDIVGHIGSIP